MFISGLAQSLLLLVCLALIGAGFLIAAVLSFAFMVVGVSFKRAASWGFGLSFAAALLMVGYVVVFSPTRGLVEPPKAEIEFPGNKY